jgi:Adenylosuccinate lyase (EC 4.3.2.2)
MIERYTRKEMAEIFSNLNKYKKWLEVELSVLYAMAELGIIPKEAYKVIDSKAYVDESVEKKIDEYERMYKHDVLAFVSAIGEQLGEYSKYFHMGLTSSDILDTALSLVLKDAIDSIIIDIDIVLELLKEKAFKYKDNVMMGRTHGVHAEPISVGLKFASWYDELKRQRERLQVAKKDVLKGKISGAVGTFSNVDPEVEKIALQKLGLEPEPAPTQIVHRDRHAYLMSVLSLIASSLEKFATEIRHYQKTEVLEMEEPFSESQRGSSAMPHKKNPIHAERICGLARVMRANMIAAFENIALWHERDISHSSAERIIIPDTFIGLDYMFGLFEYILKGLKVNTDRMLKNMDISKGLYFSSKVLVYLMQKGVDRDSAYDIVKRCAMRSWDEGIMFKDALLEDKEASKYLTKEDLDKIMDPYEFIKHRDYIFKRVFG